MSGDKYTNAAQVEAFIAPINTRVGGYVKAVNFIAHQKIKKGDTLAILDDRELRTQLAQAEANYLDARASKDVATASVNTVSNSTTVADANLAELGPNLLVARKDYQRYANLLRDDAVTQQQFDQKKAAYDALLAKRQALLGQRQSTELSTAEARSKLRVNDANIARMKAALDFARLNLSCTTIRAPYDGTLGRRNLQVGQLVQASQSLALLVRGGVQWVTANFRETQIAKLRIGQPVRITVDALGGESFRGRIGAISEATGSQYSAVPVDNSTGNFVKVQQRIPVRIEFTEGNVKADLERLRSGMSVGVRAALAPMKESFFQDWVPAWLGNTLLFVLLLPMLSLGGIYTPTVGDLVGGLGTLSEYFIMANYCATIGMIVGATLLPVAMQWQPPHRLLGGTFLVLVLVHLGCVSTTSPLPIVALSFVGGLFKIFGMIILIPNLMVLLSPTGDRMQFYAIFNPIVIGVSQAVSMLSSYLAYYYNLERFLS